MKDKIEIFIKTCKKDHDWLGYCLASIDKYAKDFNGITILTDIDHNNIFYHFGKIKKMPIRVRYLPVPDVQHNCQDGIGYLWMQNVKLLWHNFCEADAVFQIDSDCIFTSTVSPELYLSEDRWRWWVRPWSLADFGIVHRNPLDKFLGRASKYEHMLFNGWILERNSTLAFHEFVKNKYNCTWWEYLLNVANNDWGGPTGNRRGSSVYNAFGGFLETYKDVKKYYEFVEKTDIVPPIKQYWSWGGLTNNISSEISSLLAKHDVCVDISLVIEALGDREYELIDGQSLLISNLCITTKTEYWDLKKLDKKYKNILIVAFPNKIDNNILTDRLIVSESENFKNTILDKIGWLVDVDEKFDEIEYQEKYPETLDYYQPWAEENNISEKRRLFHHFFVHYYNY